MDLTKFLDRPMGIPMTFMPSELQQMVHRQQASQREFVNKFMNVPKAAITVTKLRVVTASESTTSREELDAQYAAHVNVQRAHAAALHTHKAPVVVGTEQCPRKIRAAHVEEYRRLVKIQEEARACVRNEAWTGRGEAAGQRNVKVSAVVYSHNPKLLKKAYATERRRLIQVEKEIKADIRNYAWNR